LAAIKGGAERSSEVGQSVLGVLSESVLRTLLADASLFVNGFRPYNSSSVFKTDV
jgi:hypothetical protein